MKKLIREHVRRLRDEQETWGRYLREHQDESETMLFALTKLGVELNKLKIEIWLALIGETKPE